MTSVKPRPPNGPGANGLRGGIKQYIPKTITGRWLEEFGGPAGFNRGFTTVDYETEGQNQQKGAKFRQSREFGPELPYEGNPVAPSSPFRYEATPKDESVWLTNSQLMGRSVLVRDHKKEEATALPPRIDRETLDNYRKTWTTDPDYQRDRRFVTETRLSTGNLGAKFTVKSVRALPGTPKPMELLRNQLVEKYGLFAFTVLRSILGNEGVVSSAEFRRAISSLSRDLKLYQINQIIAYISPVDEIPLEKFYYVLKGSVVGYDRKIMERLLKAIDAQRASSAAPLTWDDVIRAVNGDEHPEIVECMQEYALPLYVQDAEAVSAKELEALVLDMFAVSPETFEDSMRQMWRDY